MVELVLASSVAVVGERLQGELVGLTEPAEVALVRVERCPAGTLPVSISSCVVGPTEPTFELVVPAGVPPGCVGVRCQLGFVVRARSPVRGRRRTEVVVAVEVRGGEQAVHEGDHLHDRLIASYPARHFHRDHFRGSCRLARQARVDGGAVLGTVALVVVLEGGFDDAPGTAVFVGGEGFEKLAGAFSHGERDAGIVADSARAFGVGVRHGDSVYHLRGYADERRHRQSRSTARTA